MIVSFPSASIFAFPNLMSEHIDELLYGDSVEILEEVEDFYKIKTDYNYIGWIKKSNLTESNIEANYIVTSSFADLLFEERYYYKPAITLPKGSKIRAEIKEGSRYASVIFADRRTYYIHKENITSLDAIEKENEEKLRASIIETALSYLGTQYRWGGRTSYGIDCSGLCFNAYRFNNIKIWRDADIDKSESLKKISLKTAKIGDLLFFKGHMAIYLGNDRIVHSSASRGKVVVEELNEKLREIYICAGTAF